MAPYGCYRQRSKWFADKARGYGLPKVGIMIEVPRQPCASSSKSIVDPPPSRERPDAQYRWRRTAWTATRRLQPTRGGRPSWRCIRTACNGGRATGKRFSVCGEAGGDPLLALVLTPFRRWHLRSTRFVRLCVHDLATPADGRFRGVDAPTRRKS